MLANSYCKHKQKEILTSKPPKMYNKKIMLWIGKTNARIILNLFFMALEFIQVNSWDLEIQPIWNNFYRALDQVQNTYI